VTSPPVVLLARQLAGELDVLRRCLAAGAGAGEILLFRDPEEGIRILGSRPVDLVVLPVSEGAAHEGIVACARRAVPEIPVLGVLAADGGDGAAARECHEELALPLEGGRLARAVDRALRWRELSRRLHEKEREVQTLDEVGRAMLSSVELKAVLNVIMEKTRELVRAESWAVLLLEEGREGVLATAATGGEAGLAGRRGGKPGEGIAGWVAREGKPALVPDAAADPRCAVGGQPGGSAGTGAVLCVPLEARGSILGVIEIVNKQGGGAFTERDLGLAAKLADFAAIAIENARLYQQTKQLTLTDELTELYNTRFFTQYLDAEVKRCRRYKGSVSLIFLDLDFFKRVNDEHGHLVGSQLLREVADVLRDGVRDVDIVARYGGDEFIVILPETRIAEAAAVAGRLRTCMNEQVFLTGKGLAVKLTASFGVAAFPETCGTEEELIRLADEAMYRVKNLNRDGVFIAEPLPQPEREETP
jgi:diguanylate cyclase (GGDEF)-like protein